MQGKENLPTFFCTLTQYSTIQPTPPYGLASSVVFTRWRRNAASLFRFQCYSHYAIPQYVLWTYTTTSWITHSRLHALSLLLTWCPAVWSNPCNLRRDWRKKICDQNQCQHFSTTLPSSKSRGRISSLLSARAKYLKILYQDWVWRSKLSKLTFVVKRPSSPIGPGACCCLGDKLPRSTGDRRGRQLPWNSRTSSSPTSTCMLGHQSSEDLRHQV